jgi:hypothetical protein
MPPNTSITALAAASAVAAKVTVSAAAPDNIGVVEVQFKKVASELFAGAEGIDRSEREGLIRAPLGGSDAQVTSTRRPSTPRRPLA